MTMKKLLLFYLLIPLAFTSCVVSKGNLSATDYNGRRTLSNPHYTIKKKPIAHTIKVSMGVVGAMVARNKDLVTYYSGVERKHNQPLNALIGGMIGYGLGNLFTRMLGLHKNKKRYPKTRPELRKWIDKQKVVSGNYTFVQHYKIIENRYEPSYQVRNISDVRDFRKAFPNSLYYDRVVQQSVNRLQRRELMEVYQLYPNGKYTHDLQRKYIRLSPNVQETIHAGKQFSSLQYLAEQQAAQQVYTASDVRSFRYAYPRSTYRNGIIQRLYPQFSRTDLPILIALCKDCAASKKAQKRVHQLTMAYRKQQAEKARRRAEARRIKKENIADRYAGSLSRLKDNYSRISNYRYPHTYQLVKLTYESTNDEQAILDVEEVIEELESQKWRQFTLVGVAVQIFSRGRYNIDPDGHVIENIKEAGVRGKRGIVAATWYRAGTNGFQFLATGRKFSTFQANMRRGLARRGIQMVSCEYLGNYNDDIADRRRDERIRREIEAERRAEEIRKQNTPCATIVDHNYTTRTSCDIKYTVETVKCRSGRYRHLYYWPGCDAFGYSSKPSYYEYVDVWLADDNKLYTTDKIKALNKLCNCDE